MRSSRARNCPAASHTSDRPAVAIGLGASQAMVSPGWSGCGSGVSAQPAQRNARLVQQGAPWRRSPDRAARADPLDRQCGMIASGIGEVLKSRISHDGRRLQRRGSRHNEQDVVREVWGHTAVQIAFSVLVFTETRLVPIEGWLATAIGRVRLSSRQHSHCSGIERRCIRSSLSRAVTSSRPTAGRQ